MLSGMRGLLIGGLGLVGLEVIVTTSQKAAATGGTDPLSGLIGAVTGTKTNPNGLVQRILSPSIPLFGKPAAAKKTAAGTTSGNAVLAAQDSAAVGGGNQGAQAVAVASAQIGKPYEWGATGPDSFDCSGLVQFAYAQLGDQLGRTTYDQVTEGANVPSLAQAEPGDLVFFNEGTGAPPEHVGIYAGDNEMIDAPDTGSDVRLEPVWTSQLYAIRRPTGATLPADVNQGAFV